MTIGPESERYDPRYWIVRRFKISRFWNIVTFAAAVIGIPALIALLINHTHGVSFNGLDLLMVLGLLALIPIHLGVHDRSFNPAAKEYNLIKGKQR